MASDKDKDGTPARNLYQRLAAVQAEIEAVPKTGRNVAFSYAYIEQGMVMAVLRPKLAAHGVVLVPRVLGSAQTVGTTQKGGQQITERVSVEFTLVNADDPTDTLVVPWLAEGQDSTDKAINKAIVAAQKYMLMKLFLISDADDPDGGGEETAKPAGHREQAAAANGQRRQAPTGGASVQPAPAIKRVGPRGAALGRVAAEMASEAEATAERPQTRSVEQAKAALKEACLRVGLPAPLTLREVNALAGRYGATVVGSSAGVTGAWLDDLRAHLPDLPVGPLDPEHADERATLLEALRATCRALGRPEPRDMDQLCALAAEAGMGLVASWDSVTTGWLEAIRRGMGGAPRTGGPSGTSSHPQAVDRTEQALAGWIAAAPDGATLEHLATDVAEAHEAGTLTDATATALLVAVDARGAELDLYHPTEMDPDGPVEVEDDQEEAPPARHTEVDAVTAG